MAAHDVPTPAGDGWTPPGANTAPAANGRRAHAPAVDTRPVSWADTPGHAVKGEGRISATTWPGGFEPKRPPLAPNYMYAPEPARPQYRETLRIGPAGIWAGAGVASLWFLISGLLATTLTAYVWVTAVAALVAWLAASLLARYGDRGAAAGVAAVSGMALGVAGLVVEWNALHGDWILW
ncbi:hypothetical protein [Phytomonospora endophytica]|uniref:Uncharacterized protein n=1 Tax=Phytomonospora endophytica TaxID=714109 RepID=A0A841FJV5_9ACTN|nr:hypothetical protein [Phytomonospora endophytica]MBB6035223.1 hypothetical protein [Phytomonospora endophytica]GIG64028.1 hypothetical protein Pen01_03230 [Phytomonospora endophytica]